MALCMWIHWLFCFRKVLYGMSGCICCWCCYPEGEVLFWPQLLKYMRLHFSQKGEILEPCSKVPGFPHSIWLLTRNRSEKVKVVTIDAYIWTPIYRPNSVKCGKTSGNQKKLVCTSRLWADLMAYRCRCRCGGATAYERGVGIIGDLGHLRMPAARCDWPHSSKFGLSY